MEHYRHDDGLSGDSVLLFLKTEKGSSGLELRTESTAFAIRESPRSRQVEGLGSRFSSGRSGQQRWHDLGSKRRIA